MEPPGDPGGSIPEVAYVVSIYDCSSMDTDASTSVKDGNTRRKRSAIRTCRHCNKKRSKRQYGDDKKLRDDDCHCPSDNNLNEKSLIASTSHSHTHSPQIQRPVDNSLSVTPPPVARLLYQKSDAYPYLIHIQRNQLSPNDGITLHPITFGKFLKNNTFSNIINGSLKRIGRNRLAISFSDYKSANDFIESQALVTANYKAFVPSYNVTRVGIVRGVPSEWTDEEIKENVTVPVGCGSILKVRRIKRKIIENGVTFLNVLNL